jgi:hypothetical protein
MKPALHVSAWRPRRRVSSRPAWAAALACAAALAAAIALGVAPAACAAAADGQALASGSLTVRDQSGQAAELLDDVTLPQLASVLSTSPATLSAQLNDGEADVQLNEIVSNSSQLQSVVETLLADVQADGQIGELASELDVPVSILEAPALAPLDGGELAGTLGTTTDELSSTLAGSGAIAKPLTQTTPLVAAPVLDDAGGLETELVGAPTGEGGVTLVTVGSPGPAGPAGPAGAGPAAAAASPVALTSNAFSIVSIERSKSGLITERVKLPGTGRLVIKGTAKETVARSAKKGRRRTTSRTIELAPLATTIAGGTWNIALYPQINPANRIVLSLTTTFKPASVAANAKHSAVTLKAIAKKGSRSRG